MLHSWSLLVRPEEQMPGQTATVLADGPQPDVASGAWTAQPVVGSSSESREEKPKISLKEIPKPAIDYEAINRRMQDAVKAGKMTEEQVRQAWIEIKSRGSEKLKGSDERKILKRDMQVDERGKREDRPDSIAPYRSKPEDGRRREGG